MSSDTAQGGVKRIILLGSTGSIGVQAIDVITHLNREFEHGRHPFRYEVVGLAAGRNAATLLKQAESLDVRDLALACEEATDLATGNRTLRRGVNAAESLVRDVQADVVVGAMVGAAGLPATLAAIELGMDVALANKETLVAAGELVVPAAQKAGVQLLPIDSEHSALWQAMPEDVCPPCALDERVARVVITASGGPFRTWSRERIANATPAEALAHPTWTMGAKITIDSASLTNKGLEVIEAHWLFGLETDRIDVIVHPQSIIHSFVEYADGSVLAQLGAPDMRTPIQWALTWPVRSHGVSDRLDFEAMSRLDFEPPDFERFPALQLAYDVIELGGAAGAVFNAANEAAVTAFLDERIPFGRVTELAKEALHSLIGSRRQPTLSSLDDALAADAEARRFVQQSLEGARPSVVAASRQESKTSALGSNDA
mgnify:CR=1 FL=1|jgi:1-deoxy-D-xylulose-5-phosphate reductoisomerase